MAISVWFSWAVDLYMFNFRLYLAAVNELWQPDEQSEKNWSDGVGYVIT